METSHNILPKREGSLYESRVIEAVPRPKWPNKTEYLLACLGYAIGIGNIWRFPYLCYRSGGGAFLIPFILMLPFAAIPLFFMETCIGQFSSGGVLTMYKMCPLFQGAGYSMIGVNACCSLYYSVLLSYPVLYFFRSAGSQLPWIHCNNTWNTPACMQLGVNESLATNRNIIPAIVHDRKGEEYNMTKSPADEYYHNEILQISGGIHEWGSFVKPVLIANTCSWILIYVCVANGVKTFGKVIYVTVSLPYIVLTALLIRALTLPGSLTGIKYFFIPDFSKMLKIEVWKDAALQVFFSLGPGWGGIVNMSSYNKFKNNTQPDSIVLPMINVCTSIFSGSVVFAVLGFMAHETGLPISRVATEGAGLAFITYPEAVALMPLPVLWALLFFLMFYSLGLGSIFGQLESVITTICDQSQTLRKYRKWVALSWVCFIYTISLPLVTNGGNYILNLIDYYACSIPVMFICITELFMVVHIYKLKNFVRDIEFMIESKLNRTWVFFWKYATFVTLLFVLFSSVLSHENPVLNDVPYPLAANIFGWALICAIIGCIPGYIIYLIYRRGDITVKEDPSRKAPEYRLRQVEEIPREKWGNKTEFILSCMGYAIGIGNVWRFPYLCYRSGGGAFLVPFILMLPLAAIPLFFMETCLGQFPSTGVISMYKMCPLLKGAGYAMIVVNIICTVYYNVLLAYPILFFYRSMVTELPWVHCNNSWNTPACLEISERNIGNSTSVRNSLPPMFDRQGIAYNRTKTPADEYFHNAILQISSGIEEHGSLVWPLVIADVVSWVIVFLCIANGVKSVGKVVYVTVSLPYVVLFALFVRAVTLPGSWTGIKYYIVPDFKKLLEFKVWSSAALQVFFSLGPGWGGIVNMASFNKFKNNTQLDSLFLPLANVSTSVFAGAVVFAVLGFMSQETGLPIDIVATQGAGLAFITYPEAIALMPLPVLWALLFFVMFYSLGIDSIFVQIEAVITTVTDESPYLRKYKRWVTVFSIALMFILTLPLCTNGGIYILVLVDYYACSIPVMFLCFCELFMVVYIYKLKNFVRDIEFMIEKKLNRIWIFLWKYATFFVLIFVIYSSIAFHENPTYNDVEFPWQAHLVGWLLIACSLILIPLYMIYLICRRGDQTIRECIRDNLKATKDYGPADPEDYRAWRQMLREEQVLGEIDMIQIRSRTATVPSRTTVPKSHSRLAGARSSSVLDSREPNVSNRESKGSKPSQLPTAPRSFTGLGSHSKTPGSNVKKIGSNLKPISEMKNSVSITARESNILAMMGERGIGSSRPSKSTLMSTESKIEKKDDTNENNKSKKK